MHFLIIWSLYSYQHEITALLYAASGGRAEIVKLLVDHGANVEAVDNVSNRSYELLPCRYVIH